MKRPLLDATPEELKAWMAERGQRPFRARQVYRWVFCASGLKGVERNLTKGEIVEQVLRLRNLLPANERLTNLVVMGMGESLANLDNLVAALDWVCSPEGLGMGQRRVTVSTVGLPEKMRKLAAMDRQYHLAVSLHAP